RPAEEESLVGRHAVNRGDVPPFDRLLKRGVRDRDPAKIRDAFSLDELAVLVQAGLHDVAVELLDDAGGALLEILAVLRRPPISQIALSVELAASVVEAVRHLVADHGADAAIVERLIGIGV